MKFRFMGKSGAQEAWPILASWGCEIEPIGSDGIEATLPPGWQVGQDLITCSRGFVRAMKNRGTAPLSFLSRYSLGCWSRSILGMYSTSRYFLFDRVTGAELGPESREDRQAVMAWADRYYPKWRDLIESWAGVEDYPIHLGRYQWKSLEDSTPEGYPPARVQVRAMPGMEVQLPPLVQGQTVVVGHWLDLYCIEIHGDNVYAVRKK